MHSCALTLSHAGWSWQGGAAPRAPASVICTRDGKERRQPTYLRGYTDMCFCEKFHSQLFPVSPGYGHGLKRYQQAVCRSCSQCKSPSLLALLDVYQRTISSSSWLKLPLALPEGLGSSWVTVVLVNPFLKKDLFLLFSKCLRLLTCSINRLFFFDFFILTTVNQQHRQRFTKQKPARGLGFFYSIPSL